MSHLGIIDYVVTEIWDMDEGNTDTEWKEQYEAVHKF